MNCVQLQKSLTESEDGSSAEQQAHLKTCSECSILVAELARIASAARELRAADEPSPRVWNSIEIALRQQGLIRPQPQHHSLLPSFGSSWGFVRWMAPVAAALLVAVGIYFQQHSATLPASHNASTPAVAESGSPGSGSDFELAGLNDDDLLLEIAEQSPAVQAQYTDNLRSVNEYIRDAKTIVASDPNDEDARRSLMEAYQQKAMLFELALDRSLP
jgi:hypothetical protein